MVIVLQFIDKQRYRQLCYTIIYRHKVPGKLCNIDGWCSIYRLNYKSKIFANKNLINKIGCWTLNQYKILL